MALETGSFISDLTTSNPPGTDAKSQGDDHLRLIKTTVQGSFPNSDRAFYIPVALAAKTTAYTVVAADENSLIQVDASSGALTATLPAISGVDDGWTVSIMKSDSSANAVTIDGNGAETINGSATSILSNQYDIETVIRDGSEWKILSSALAASAILADLNTLGVVSADGEMIVGTGAGAFAYESGGTLRTSIGVAIGTDVQAFGAVLVDFNTLGAAAADGEFIVATGAGVFAYESGATARASLGLVIGTDVQAFDAVLDDLAALSVIADNEVIVGTGAGAYANESGATLRTSLGLAIGTDVQAFDAVLEDIAALSAVADNEFIVGTGAGTYAHESGATARTSMGAIATIVEDTTPQLGGDLDLNGNNLDFPTTSNISDCLDEDDMSSNSATMLATQQSIKSYVDTNAKDLEFVSTAAIALATTITVTGLAAGYDYIFALEAFSVTDDIEALWMRFSDDAGVSYEAGAADYGWVVTDAGAETRDDSDSEIQLTGATVCGNDAGTFSNIEITLHNPQGTSENTLAHWIGHAQNGTPQSISIFGGGEFQQGTDAVDAVQFLWSGGSTFKAQGDITVWRRKRS